MSDLPMHPLQTEIVARRKSGWHPLGIQRELHRLGHDVDLEIVLAICQTVEESIPSPLKVMLGGQEPIVDPYADMSQLIRVEQSRLARILEAEEGEGKVSPGVNSYINMLWHHLAEMAVLERERSVTTHPPAETPNMPTLRDLLQDSLRQSDKVTIREITAERT